MNETPKYLYIDDEEVDSLQSIINGLNDTGLIEVELLKLNSQMHFEEIKERILKYNDIVNGYILDLKLDGTGPNRLQFSAPTLASDIRTRSSLGELSHKPIILCSTEANMRSTYDVDKPSHDLFDYKFKKSVSPDWMKISKKLASLAIGYDDINQDFKNKGIDFFLKRENLEKLDPRIFEKFANNPDIQTYDYAQFIIKDLFHHPGILIKERVLASRAGIDIEASGEAWCQLVSAIFDDCAYKGVFSGGWNRFWADSVLTIFKNMAGGSRYPILSAKERVELIKSKTNIKGLVVASPIEHCKSTRFWTICEGSKKPLDPQEGFKVYESVELKPWQEAKYISFEAINSGKYMSKGLRPQSIEFDRIELFKEELNSSKK